MMCGVRWTAVAALAMIAMPVGAQWSAASLHPDGSSASVSRASAVHGGYQAGTLGYDGIDFTQEAVLWEGTSSSWVSMNPPGARQSGILGGSAALQVGWIRTPFQISPGRGPFAGLWHGTAESFVPLHPGHVGAGLSQALGTDGVTQVGWASFTSFGTTSVEHAGLWTGSGASWVDLHPAGAEHSIALDVSGERQVGHATVGGARRAALWSGTSASWMDLNPTGAEASTARAIDGGVQGGSATFQGVERAGLWSGSATSWVDLHPGGASSSEIRDVAGGWQVGVAELGGEAHASLWAGGASTWIDLGQFAPAGFRDTEASGVWTDGDRIDVVGSGFNETTQRVEALYWTIPAPGSVGVMGVSGVACLRRRRRHRSD